MEADVMQILLAKIDELEMKVKTLSDKSDHEEDTEDNER